MNHALRPTYHTPSPFHRVTGVRALLLLLALLVTGCGQPDSSPTPADSAGDDTLHQCDSAPKNCPAPPRYTATERRLLDMGLVDVQELDSTILVHLVYATADNFMGQVLYTDIHHAFLLPQLAQKVAAAQHELHSIRPDLSLLVLDAVRPLSVQRTMFHQVQGTPLNIYVSNPRNGPGLHNYGAAVDITLADTLGNALPMGSDFDHFGVESHTDREAELLASGLITQEEYDNRRLLRRLMRGQGLFTFRSEWWHFNLMSRTRAQQTLKPVDL